MADVSHTRNPSHSHVKHAVVVDEAEAKVDTQVKEFAALSDPPADRYFLDEGDKSPESEKSSSLLPWIMAILLCIAGAIIFYTAIKHAGTFSNAMVSTTPTPTPPAMAALPTATTTPTPAQINKSAAKISVLNGSGTPGLANQVKQLLEKAGYTNITTGNADSYSYTQTTITTTAQATSLVTDIIAVLKPRFTVTTASSLPASTADIEIIIGSQ